MNRFFNMDNGFWRFLTRCTDAVILNLLFLISTVPIFAAIYYGHNLPNIVIALLLAVAFSPIPAAYTAMYYFCLKAVKDEEGYLLQSFLKSFRLNYKQAFVIGLIMAVLGIFLSSEIKYTYDIMVGGGSILWRILFFILVGVAILLFTTFIYVFPLLSRFYNKTFILIRNAALMGLKHLATTVPLILIGLLALFIGWYIAPLSYFFIFGAWVYVSSVLLDKVFDRYYEKSNPDRFEEGYYLGPDVTPQDETGDDSEKEQKDNL